jgi:hypothetical protein
MVAASAPKERSKPIIEEIWSVVSEAAWTLKAPPISATPTATLSARRVNEYRIEKTVRKIINGYQLHNTTPWRTRGW